MLNLLLQCKMEIVGVEMQILRLKHQIGRRLVRSRWNGMRRGFRGGERGDGGGGGGGGGGLKREIGREKTNFFTFYSFCIFVSSILFVFFRVCRTMYQYLACVCPPICIIFVFNLLLPPAARSGGCLVRNIFFLQEKGGFLFDFWIGFLPNCSSVFLAHLL